MSRSDAAYELEGIREEISTLVERAWDLVQKHGGVIERARAQRYWVYVLRDALGDEDGDCSCTMHSLQNTINELYKPEEDEDE